VTRGFCVVGAGISGLVAAYRIRTAVGPDAEIVVFDPADRPGGVLRTETLGGQPFDIGAEAFIVRRPEVPALLAELGLADRQISPTGVRTTIFSQGRLHPLPPGTVNGIPGSAEVLTGLVDAATREWIAAEPDRPMSWQHGADPSVGALVADRFGAQVVARSVDPMLSGVYAGSAAGIGLRSAVPAVAAALDAGAPNLTAAVRSVLPGGNPGPVFGAIEGGYRVLIEALIAAAGIRLVRTPVAAIGTDGDRWSLTDGDGGSWVADGVVVATPAPQAAALLAGPAPRAAELAARVRVASAAVLALAMPPGTAFPPQSGVLVASGEGLRSKAITLSSRKWGRRGEAELVRLSFGRFEDDLARTAPARTLERWAAEDLATLFGITAEPLEVLLHRWIDALPQYGPGHGELVAELRAALPDGLGLAGNYLDGVGVPGCLVAAGRAAVAAAG